MTTLDTPRQTALIAAAQAGDERAFRLLVEPFRGALEVHCYRMLGSLQDAEDTLQEVLLRAWNGLECFERRASVRTWLYRIATNACLDEVERRPRRPATVDPYPDARLDDVADPIADPAARYALHEGMELALLAAIQLLPGRQRAVLILRDVLGWSGPEVATLLDTTGTAVNSALQRARETLEAEGPAPGRVPETASRTRALLRECVDAWERVDIEELVALLHDDAVMRMPPQHTLRSAAAIGAFFDRLPGRGSFRDIQVAPAWANRRPALVMHRGGHPHGLLVLEIAGPRIAAIDAFISEEVVARFTADPRSPSGDRADRPAAS